MTPWTSGERHELLDRLEADGLYLNSLWGLSELYWTEEVRTAAVVLSDNKIKMVFNPTFWESLGEDGQLFVTCHEQLHLMSDHFERMRFGEGDDDNKNRAADVAINEMLVRNFHFTKESIPDWEKYCWADTVFPPEQNVSCNETAEYYYALIKKNEEQGEKGGGEPIDDHQYGGDNKSLSKPMKDALEEAVEEVKKKIEESSNTPSEDLDRTQIDKTPTMGTGSQTHTFKKKRQKSWKTIYKNVPKQILDQRLEPHWRHMDRRSSLLTGALMLPGETEVDIEERVKVNVYLDTSGSCIDAARYFLKSALTLPEDMFEVTIFGFVEHVYEIDTSPPYKLRGFGAESYPAVVEHVANWGPLDAIFVFTDGYSPFISPPQPHKWHWMIPPGGITTQIDAKCNIYDLTQYNWKG